MGRHGDHAREILMNTAERLFAENGVDSVSNRRIVEEAGAANHSAITYHFGTRDDLILAIAQRHSGPARERRLELTRALGPDASAHDMVRSRLLPFIETLDALPRPSWHARFLFQARSVPTLVASTRESLERDDGGIEWSMRAALPGVPDVVRAARARILGNLVLGVCADYEQRFADDTHDGTWTDVGYFLIDAAAGMLAAPVTLAGGRAAAGD